MPGTVTRVGTASFPDNRQRLPCGVYEWTSPASGGGKGYFVRFLSPDGEPGPRCFYVEDLLRHWLDPKPARRTPPFLDLACAEGYKLLSQVERHSHRHRELYRVARALFRNREAGHTRVARQFNHTVDFADIRPGRVPMVISPLLGCGDDRTRHEPGTPLAVAQNLLRSALARGAEEAVGFRDVLEVYRSVLLQPHHSHTSGGTRLRFPLHELPFRGDIDLLFTDGLERLPGWDWDDASEKVRSALIYGPVAAGDFQQVAQDGVRFDRFLKAVRRSVKARKPADFDRWLKNTREHGHLALLGATRLTGQEREDAQLRAERIACALLWLSYGLMGRCYGALMLGVLVDLCLHADFSPTEEEKWLFRQMHFPQAYLAGLPLDFLGRAQMRWVLRGLHELWAGPTWEPEPYDGITALLGGYGELVRERRGADRGRKAGAGQAAGLGRAVAGGLDVGAGEGGAEGSVEWAFEGSEKEDDAPRRRGRGKPSEPFEVAAGLPEYLDDETPPELKSKYCPKCGTELKLLRTRLWKDAAYILAAFFCPGCGAEQDYLINRATVAALAGPSGPVAHGQG
jgi:hypothetical protein